MVLMSKTLEKVAIPQRQLRPSFHLQSSQLLPLFSFFCVFAAFSFRNPGDLWAKD
jgi:hypothetical protein